MLGAFDPTAVRIMADAFDEAWLIIEEDGDVNRQNRQKMRLALAKCIVELASYRDYNASALRDAALDLWRTHEADVRYGLLAIVARMPGLAVLAR
jgi:hypothetical protein